jgi:hypothetical protein
MGPTKTVVTIVEMTLIFRAIAWIVKSQHTVDRTQQVVRWACVIGFGFVVLVIGCARWNNSNFGLFVLIGSLILFLLFLMLPDCAYYVGKAFRRSSGDKLG